MEFPPSLSRKLTRRAVLLVMLLACLGWQDFAALSHVHAGAGLAAHQGRHAPADGRSDCSLCQVVLGGGGPVARAAVLLLAPVLSLLFFLPALRRIVLPSAVSHSWNSRGPPLT